MASRLLWPCSLRSAPPQLKAAASMWAHRRCTATTIATLTDPDTRTERPGRTPPRSRDIPAATTMARTSPDPRGTAVPTGFGMGIAASTRAVSKAICNFAGRGQIDSRPAFSLGTRCHAPSIKSYRALYRVAFLRGFCARPALWRRDTQHRLRWNRQSRCSFSTPSTIHCNFPDRISHDILANRYCDGGRIALQRQARLVLATLSFTSTSGVELQAKGRTPAKVRSS